MSESEIDQLLGRNRYGRLGFVLDEEIYVIPVNYAWDGRFIYVHAAPGTKVRAMRSNPRVAFEVDEIEDAAHWRSVLLHGPFCELHDRSEKSLALQRIQRQAGGGERSEATWALDLDQLVIFRIEGHRRSGRLEQREAVELRPAKCGPLPVSGIPPRSQT